jgi:hypothetical protein
MARDAGQKDRESVARTKVAELEKRLSKLTIIVEQPVSGLEIIRGGASLSRAEWGVAVPVDPGALEIRARAQGHRPWRKSIDVPPDRSTLEVRIPKLERSANADVAPGPGPAPRSEPIHAPPDESSWLGRNALGLTALGIGVAGLGVGTYFGLRAKSKHDDSKPECPDDQCTLRGLQLRDDALDAAAVSTVAFGVGIVGIGTGVVLLIASGSKAKDSDAGMVVTPMAGRELGGFAVRGHF